MEQISAMVSLPEGFGLELLKRSDIPALIEAIRTWHPDIAVGGGSCYLRESFYDDYVYLAGEAEKTTCAGIFIATGCAWTARSTRTSGPFGSCSARK